MALAPDNIEMDAEFLVTKEYGPDNIELSVDKLTEVFCVVYTYCKKGQKEPEEVFSFTTDFEQAMKKNNKFFYKNLIGLFKNCKILTNLK